LPREPQMTDHIRTELLTRSALNRATLARQLLIERARMPALAAIEHLVGMQAQAPQAPYVGLWSRLQEFRPDELSELISARRAVRAPLMRATLHLVSSADFAALRPVVEPVLERSFAGAPFDVEGIDRSELLEAGRSLLRDGQLTRPELGAALARRWPDHDPSSLAHAITYLLPVVQVPPRGLWGLGGAARWTAAETWLEGVSGAAASREEIVLRHLAAFGPATVRDIQTWSGLTRLAEVLDRLRPRLCTFRDEHGAELFDLPDAPRPDPDTPAPPRFLPEYDNLLLSYAERGRFIPGAEPVPLPPGLGARSGTLLVDGFLRATWTIRRERGAATLFIEPFDRITDREAIVEEGARLLALAAADAGEHDVSFTAPSA
jgi:Winged helix DNA-binding domain